MKRNQFIIALSLLACTLLSCQNEKKQQSSIANKSNKYLIKIKRHV